MRYFLTLTIICITTGALVSFKGTKSLTVTSSAFQNNGPIPIKYTCKGPEFSPPLQFGNVPDETKSLVVIVEEPNVISKIRRQKICVPNKVSSKSKHGKKAKGKKLAALYETVEVKDCYTHWLIWNIDPASHFIPENFVNDNQGLNSVNECRYKGMCPGEGTHSYHFKVYALDTKLNISNKSNKAALEKVMEGHILAWGETVGVFNKDYR